MIAWYWLIWTAMAAALFGFVLCALFSAAGISEARGKLEWLRQKYNHLLDDYHRLEKQRGPLP